MKPNDVAIRKRTQIAQANKTMFIWIAIASALVGSSLVVSYFLFQKARFGEEVLALKQTTASNLDYNNSVVPNLQSQIRVLDTNQALMSSKANESDQAIQVILDALPAEGNSLALGASLQNKLLAGIPGLISIDSLQVDPIVGLEAITGDVTTVDAQEGESQNEITFRLTVKGSQDAIRDVLRNFERSIRVLDITSVQIETQTDGQLMTLQARAYYEPAKTIQLRDEVKKP